MDPKIEQLVRMGFELSYADPSSEAGIPLDEPWLTYYRQGMDAGRTARAEADAAYTGPSIGVDRGGETWDAYQKRLAEQLEFLFHKHEPHIEVRETEFEAVPVSGTSVPVD